MLPQAEGIRMLLLCLLAHGKGYAFIDTFYWFATVSTGNSLSSDHHEKGQWLTSHRQWLISLEAAMQELVNRLMAGDLIQEENKPVTHTGNAGYRADKAGHHTRRGHSVTMTLQLGSAHWAGDMTATWSCDILENVNALRKKRKEKKSAVSLCLTKPAAICRRSAGRSFNQNDYLRDWNACPDA